MSDPSTDGIEPCVGCEKTVDALYCSYTCMQEDDDARVLESPLTGKLYYVTEYVEKGDGKFVAYEKQRINFPNDTDTDRSAGDDDE